MSKNPPSMSSTNKSMNGGFNLTKKQSRRHSNLLSKKHLDLMPNSKSSPKAKSTKPHNARKCSGGLKVKGSSLRIPKAPPSTKPLRIPNLLQKLLDAGWKLSVY